MNRLLIFGVILTSVSASFAYQVLVNFDRNVDFSCYKTYRLVHSNRPAALPAPFPTGLQNRVDGFVQERLAAEGLKPVASGGDLVISYRIRVSERPQNINLSEGVGPTGLGWGDTTYVATARTIHEWTLVIDMVDSKQNHLVFEGTLSQTSSSNRKKNTRKLAKAVDEILEKYPPRP